MVVKQRGAGCSVWNLFESSVIPSGSKTYRLSVGDNVLFESSVIPSGSKTGIFALKLFPMFESSVIPSGSKTYS